LINTANIYNYFKFSIKKFMIYKSIFINQFVNQPISDSSVHFRCFVCSVLPFLFVCLCGREGIKNSHAWRILTPRKIVMTIFLFFSFHFKHFNKKRNRSTRGIEQTNVGQGKVSNALNACLVVTHLVKKKASENRGKTVLVLFY